MTETITIKPSVKEYIPPFILLATFCSLLLFFSILIFEKQIDFVPPLMIIILMAVIFIFVFAPSVLFEQLTLNQNDLVHKRLFRQESIAINEIKSIREEMPYKRGDQLVFVSPNKQIRIIYQTYPENSLKNFLQKLLQINPKIKNQFDAIELE